ncbi:LysR family transcriptional regulator [Ralstonia sp.]|jgi:DNA-binding transcriptional LysR family regulator|uniref:LysR family transcriptional regulator n=1 Tax=Ralstonia sp. TaxID=54061 RepID=UPI002CA57647|nr:LysR substrate-binding domain-containing protein [Ralstonia sp.]HWV07071.1 LysR substrate-binding domain-containing protein [Ralstonia sp.]
MRLRQIEVFRAVMLVGTVSEAARMLNVSQPVVTRVLQHTELQLGFRLFDRTKGRLQPTAEAFELFSEVERLYQEVERVRRVSANLRHKGAGRLRVAATPSLAPSILAPAVRRFSQRHPDTLVRVFTHHTAEIVQGLLSQDIDVGFAFAPPVHPAISTTPVAQGRILLAAPRAWVGGKTDGRALHKLVAEKPFIGLEDQISLGSLVGQTLARGGLAPQSTLEVQTYSLARSLVEESLGVTMLDQFTAATGSMERIALFALEPAQTFDVRAMRAEHHAPSSLADSLVQCFAEAARALSDELPQRVERIAFVLKPTEPDSDAAD